MNTAADSTARAALSVRARSEILRARVDGSDMVSFDGVVFVGFVAQVYKRHQIL